MGFAKGFRPDSVKRNYPGHHRLISASMPSLPDPNHLPYRRGAIWQSNIGECVGAATKRCVQLWNELAGRPSQPMISATAAYGVGRSEETADNDDPDNPTPLRDVGSEPGLVLLGAQRVGVFLETDFPDPTSPDFDPATANQRPTVDQLVKAYDMRGLDFFEIEAAPGARREAIRACMMRRQPVMFAMFVDTGIENNTGEIVRHVRADDPDGGGHMLTLLDGTDDDHAIVDNWWDYPPEGINWGVPANNSLGLPRGVWRLAWPVLEQATYVFAVRGGPLTLKAAS